MNACWRNVITRARVSLLGFNNLVVLLPRIFAHSFVCKSLNNVWMTRGGGEESEWVSEWVRERRRKANQKKILAVIRKNHSTVTLDSLIKQETDLPCGCFSSFSSSRRRSSLPTREQGRPLCTVGSSSPWKPPVAVVRNLGVHFRVRTKEKSFTSLEASLPNAFFHSFLMTSQWNPSPWPLPWKELRSKIAKISSVRFHLLSADHVFLNLKSILFG